MEGQNTLYHGIWYTPAHVKALRGWVSDCQWVEDQDEIDEMSDYAILRNANRHLDGGLDSFDFTGIDNTRVTDEA